MIVPTQYPLDPLASPGMSGSLNSLLNRASLDDHDALLDASEKVLKSSTSDSQAQQIKAVALLKLERYTDALTFFEQSTTLQSEIPEAYAYCLYKNGKFEQAVKVASAADETRGALHLVLQAAYRAEDWEAANEAHSVLAKQTVSKEEFDLHVNKLALDAEGLWLEKLTANAVPRATTDDLAAFDTAYNAACISVSKGQLQEADILLKRAISLCEHSDDLPDDVRATELVPIKAQRIYILQRLGKNDEAQALAKELESSLATTSVDSVTRKLAENNILTSTKHSNPFILHKTFNQTSIPKEERLFANQSASLISNQHVAELQSFKFDGLVDAAKKKHVTDSLPSISSDILLTSVFSAAARARNEITKAAVSKVLPELEQRPNDIGLVVTIVQLYVLTGNTSAAVDLLHTFFENLEESTTEKDQDIRYSPGLVGLAISLYRSQGRRSQLKQELAKSASYWRTKSKAPSALLRAAGVALLESATEEDDHAASEIFDKLYSQDSNDRSTIAGYVASHATEESDQVKTLANKLRPISELTSSVDVASLENAGIPQSANALAIAQAGQTRKRAAVSNLAASTKRLRKNRLPKDYDPEKKPDPERWLPLRDRSSYKPKKRKGKKDDRTQGGGNVNESLDISNRPAGSGTEVVTSNTSGKKKKGKGKK